MRRLIAVILLAGLAFQVSAKNITKDIKVANFNSIEISTNFDVVIEKSIAHSLSVSLPEELEQYLIARVNRDGTLILGLDTRNMPVKTRMEKRNIVAMITLPKLKELEVSGVSKVTINDEFSCDEFDLELSGTSKVSGLKISAREIKVECSGTSKVVGDLDGKEIELSVSGGSAAECTVDAEKLEVEVSGASRAILEGKAGDVDAEVSGASSLKAWNLAVKYCEAEVSGASSAEINVSDRLEVEARGASSVSYPSTIKNLIEKEISGASTLRSK